MTYLSKLPYAGVRIKVIIFIVVIGLFGGFALFKCRKYKKVKF